MTDAIPNKENVATVSDLFFLQASLHPYKIALYFEDQRIDYHTLALKVSILANALAQRGVRRGDHVGLVLPNSPMFVLMMLVAAELGLALVPVNPSLHPESIAKAFLATDVKHLVSDSLHYEDWVSERFEWHWIKGLLLSVDDWFGDAKFVVPKNLCMVSELLNAVQLQNSTYERGHAEDAFILTMTSGSTGDPKPIVLTQRIKINRAKAAQTLYNITAEDITLAATPLYHSLAERLVLIPLLTGGSSVLMGRYSPNEWISHINRFKVSFTIAVSSQLKQAASLFGQVGDLSLVSLRCLVSSSALLESEVKQQLVEHLICDFHECYGTSEIAIASNLSGKITQKLKSVGTAAPTANIVILDENKQLLPIGQPGEIACKTSMLFGGYYKKPELTQSSMWGEYFLTGDIGQLDAEGYLYYLGRKKDLIISGGINIYPFDIESVIAEVQGVLESAAFAFPDAGLGEVVAVAIVVDDKNQFDLKRAKHLCAKRLADYQQPRKWFLVKSIPKNSLGKVMKYQLVKQFTSAEPISV